MSRVNLVLDEAELSDILLPHIRASFPGLTYEAIIKVSGSVSVDFDLGLSLINKVLEVGDGAQPPVEHPKNDIADVKKKPGRPATKEKTSISKKEFDKALAEIDASIEKQFSEGVDIRTVIVNVSRSHPELRKEAIAERIKKAHRIWLQDHPKTSEPIGIEKELDARIMELYPMHSTKEISDMLDEEGYILTPKEIMQRVKSIQLREIAVQAGTVVESQAMEKGRTWKDDSSLEPMVVHEKKDIDDFGSQGMGEQGVEIPDTGDGE
jgi:hypothetical protein